MDATLHLNLPEPIWFRPGEMVLLKARLPFPWEATFLPFASSIQGLHSSDPRPANFRRCGSAADLSELSAKKSPTRVADRAFTLGGRIPWVASVGTGVGGANPLHRGSAQTLRFRRT